MTKGLFIGIAFGGFAFSLIILLGGIRHELWRIANALSGLKSSGSSEDAVSKLWEALKLQCAATKPTDPKWAEVSQLVMVSREKLAAAYAQARSGSSEGER